MTHIDIEASWPGRLHGCNPFDWFFRSPDGETYAEAAARATDWLADLSGITLAITHGLMSRIIRGVYLGLAQEEALRLPVPQDMIWHLGEGSVGRL